MTEKKVSGSRSQVSASESFSGSEPKPEPRNPNPALSEPKAEPRTPIRELPDGFRLFWRPTDPDGRRWELWAVNDRSSVYHGRVLLLTPGPSRRRPLITAGCFTGLQRGKNPFVQQQCDWKEQRARSLRGAASLLVLRALKKHLTPPEARGSDPE